MRSSTSSITERQCAWAFRPTRRDHRPEQPRDHRPGDRRPAPITNEDRSVAVVLNSEIYNFAQLRFDPVTVPSPHPEWRWSPYGMDKLHSVERKLERIWGHAHVTSDPDKVLRADNLILRGVAHFGKAMEHLITPQTVRAAEGGSARHHAWTSASDATGGRHREESAAAGLDLMPT